jgi:pyruvate kinase
LVKPWDTSLSSRFFERVDFSSDPEKTIALAIETLKKNNMIAIGQQVVILSDIIAGEDRVETIQVREVK